MTFWESVWRPSSIRRHLDGVDHLSDLDGFGSNPGALRAKAYIPLGLPPGAPLVIVLHGADQSAEDYDHGSGWSRHAEGLGFAVLLPEQRRANNALLCFNWYETADNRRSSGEALSIRQMIEAIVTRHGIDRERIFITGLSAGGAMAIAMLATYPEVFAGGAVIAALPYGSARGVLQAWDRMHGLGGPTPRELEAMVRDASRHTGPWPKLSVWHGTSDRTVDVSNVESLLGQWRGLHGLAASPDVREIVDGCPRRAWCDGAGRQVIEAYSVPGMGHGTPLDVQGPCGLGASSAYMLDARISSTRLMTKFWNLSGAIQ